MWMDADSEEKGHSDDFPADYYRYGADYEHGDEDGADYDGADRDGGDYGDGWSLRDDRAYWRRRFLILCGGVAALGVCAWLLPGAQQPSKGAAAAASASIAALNQRQALPPAATGASWHGGAMPDVYPTAPEQTAGHARRTVKPGQPGGLAAPAASGRAKATPSASPGGSAAPARAVSPGSAAAGACAPSGIVLSLLTGKPSYAKGAHPAFDVYAVSTQRAACTLTYGAGSVQLVVTRAGHVVWDSAACKPKPARPVRFTRGVPRILTMVWNPAARKPNGCAGSLPAGTSGTLEAVAMSHGDSSPVATFKMSS